MFEPGRWRNGANWTPKPRRLATSWSSGPFTQLTTEPSYLPGPANPVWYWPGSVRNRSWQISRPNGCSSGSVPVKLASAPLLTCIRMSPVLPSSGRRISPDSDGVTWYPSSPSSGR
jgi:hypothetical protein